MTQFNRGDLVKVTREHHKTVNATYWYKSTCKPKCDVVFMPSETPDSNDYPLFLAPGCITLAERATAETLAKPLYRVRK